MKTKIPRVHRPITLPVTVLIPSQDRVRLVVYPSDSCGKLHRQHTAVVAGAFLAAGTKSRCQKPVPSGPLRSTPSWVFQKCAFPSEWNPGLRKHSCGLSVYFLNFLFFYLSPPRPPSLPLLLSTNCILLYCVFILLFAQTHHFHFSLSTFASGEQRKNTHTPCHLWESNSSSNLLWTYFLVTQA